jgi:hypothetical protein
MSCPREALRRELVEMAALDLQGILGGVWGRMTGGITKRYLAFETRGLKARSEDPGFRHAETSS